MRGVRTRKRAQEEQQEERRMALNTKEKEQEQKAVEEEDDELLDDDDFNRMFDDKFDVFNHHQQQLTMNNDINADDANDDDGNDHGVVDGCDDVAKSSGGGGTKMEVVTSKEPPPMKEHGDDVIMMDQNINAAQNVQYAAPDPIAPMPNAKTLSATTSAGMSPPPQRAVSSRNETPRFRSPRSFHEAQVTKTPPPVSTDENAQKQPEQEQQEQQEQQQLQQEEKLPETPMPVNAEAKPPFEQTTDIPTSRHVTRIPQQQPQHQSPTRVLSPPPAPPPPPHVRELTANLPAREAVARTQEDDTREQLPPAMPPRKIARPRRAQPPAVPIFGYRPRGIDSISTEDDDTSAERLTASGGEDANAGSGHPTRRCDEPRPWQTVGLSFDAWLEQDRKDFEAECALIQNLNVKVDTLRTELEVELDDLSEMRVAVAVFVQRVNHIVNATEYQQVISEARQVANHITGMGTNEKAMRTSV